MVTDNFLLNCPFCGSGWIEPVKVLNKSNNNKFYIRCIIVVRELEIKVRLPMLLNYGIDVPVMNRF